MLAFAFGHQRSPADDCHSVRISCVVRWDFSADDFDFDVEACVICGESSVSEPGVVDSGQVLAGVTPDRARLFINCCIYTRHDLCIRSTTADRPPRPDSTPLTSGDHAVRCQESCMPACCGRRRRRRVYIQRWQCSENIQCKLTTETVLATGAGDWCW